MSAPAGEERAGAYCVGAGGTHSLYQISVDEPRLAITVFSHAVVVACGTNSALHQCKRGGIICSSLLFLHVREKKGTELSN